jgi:type II secretory pathway pseudopilin PulG
LRGNERGYAMAALLVALSVMALLLTVAMPTYKQMARREKEEELVFRGQQYARALRLFAMKYANAAPPNIDVLIEQRFLRKKYKDPITSDDFMPIMAGQSLPGASGSGSGPGSSGTQGGGAPPRFVGPTDAPQSSGGGPGRGGPQSGPGIGRSGGPGGGPGAAVGGIIGVTSKSKDESIRLFNGRNHYNEWAFMFTPQVQAPGMAVPGGALPGQRGIGGTGPNQPGTNPFGSGIGGQRGGTPNQPGRPGGPGGPGAPGGPGGRGPSTSPFSPFQPTQPAQPILPGRGRGN